MSTKHDDLLEKLLLGLDNKLDLVKDELSEQRLEINTKLLEQSRRLDEAMKKIEDHMDAENILSKRLDEVEKPIKFVSMAGTITLKFLGIASLCLGVVYTYLRITGHL